MGWKETIAAVAPTLATALGGPMAGIAAKMAADALGIEPAEIESKVLSGDPDVMLKLKAAEQSFLVEMRKLDVDLSRLGASTIIAEAQGESWLQRNWRPMVMIWLAILVGAHWLGVTPPNLPSDQVLALLDIVQVGLGGYVVGRSVEKTMKAYKG